MCVRILILCILAERRMPGLTTCARWCAPITCLPPLFSPFLPLPPPGGCFIWSWLSAASNNRLPPQISTRVPRIQTYSLVGEMLTRGCGTAWSADLIFEINDQNGSQPKESHRP